MAMLYNDNLGNRILDLLGSQPITERCTQLSALFEQCSLRELQDVFPLVVRSIFANGCGDLGWGLRTITKENSPNSFNQLHNFFAPLGTMFRLCYRLLNDAIKFEFSLELLPHKVSEMMQSGQYSLFYADLLNVDPFRRQVISLSLNAFDYYILHFVIHGTFPLHKMYPAALHVHNERLKSLYFFLTADYVCTFLPSHPDSVVLPANICPSVKVPQPVAVQQLQPRRSPKYLRIPQSSAYGDSDRTTASVTDAAAQSTRNAADSPRAFAWRSESVLHFFIDVWLRYDIDEVLELPGSEFVRVVRILVKTVHAFTYPVHLDQTPMVALRRVAQPMMRARIYPFLKSVISRWPLDSSLSVVLELWLSYIQPWRYTFEWQSNSRAGMEVPIGPRFTSFILENIVIYTQIFVHFMPRFERLDLTSFRNVLLLFRLVKVLSQSTLPSLLYHAEKAYLGNGFMQDSPHRHARHSSATGASDWDSFHGDTYVELFGPAVKAELERFVQIVSISRAHVRREIAIMRHSLQQQRNAVGLIKRLVLSFFEDHSPIEDKLQEISKIPDFLEMSVRTLCHMFNVKVPEMLMADIDAQEESRCSEIDFAAFDRSDSMDISQLSPMQMRHNLSNIKVNVDPALLPIQSHECTALVRFLHQLSCKLNQMYGEELHSYWNRADLCGKLMRQILIPPMTTQWFDKPRGVNELFEEHLPARISLRPLASYKFLTLLGVALLLGYLFYGAPSYGLFALFALYAMYVLTMAFIY